MKWVSLYRLSNSTMYLNVTSNNDILTSFTKYTKMGLNLKSLWNLYPSVSRYLPWCRLSTCRPCIFFVSPSWCDSWDLHCTRGCGRSASERIWNDVCCHVTISKTETSWRKPCRTCKCRPRSSCDGRPWPRTPDSPPPPGPWWGSCSQACGLAWQLLLPRLSRYSGDCYWYSWIRDKAQFVTN